MRNLPRDRVRALLKTVRESAELRAAGEAPQRHILESLGRMVGAAFGMLGTALDWQHVGFARPTAVTFTGLDASAGRHMMDYFRRRGRDADPFSQRAWASGLVGQVTFTRAEVASDREWYGSELVNELHRPLRVDHHILSMRPLGPSAARVMVFKRSWGDRPFNSAERDLVDLFHQECAWLDAPAAALASDVDQLLSGRERETLNHLLTGASEKEIAARLGLSRHTTHDHVKSVYRKLGVRSRVELMSRLLPQVTARVAEEVGGAALIALAAGGSAAT